MKHTANGYIWQTNVTRDIRLAILGFVKRQEMHVMLHTLTRRKSWRHCHDSAINVSLKRELLLHCCKFSRRWYSIFELPSWPKAIQWQDHWQGGNGTAIDSHCHPMGKGKKGGLVMAISNDRYSCRYSYLRNGVYDGNSSYQC